MDTFWMEIFLGKRQKILIKKRQKILIKKRQKILIRKRQIQIFALFFTISKSLIFKNHNSNPLSLYPFILDQYLVTAHLKQPQIHPYHRVHQRRQKTADINVTEVVTR